MKRPIQPGISFGGEPPADADSELREALREAAAGWPSGVAVVAVRDGGAFEAITVTSLITVSLEPPLVLVSIGEHAAIVPLLDAAGRFTISQLAAGDARTASLVADRLPTMRQLFTDDADPVLRAALTTLVCRTDVVHPAGDHRLYVGRVERVLGPRDDAPLLYHLRRYRSLGA